MDTDLEIIKPNIEKLIAYLEKNYGELKKEDRDLITKAYNFAENAHKDQIRKSGEPYFVHAFAAGLNVAKFGMGPTTVAAALLHDTIEDANVTKKQLAMEFGDDVAYLVEGVSKLEKIKYRGRERHVESLRKFFVASAEDPRVIIIKLGDRLHNIKTLEHVDEEKRRRIALETIEVHANLAWRLGMGRLTGELQDYAFPYAYPEEHKMVEKLLKQKKNINEKYIEKVYKSLKKEMALNGVKDIKTYHRMKKEYSLYKKLVSKNMDIDKIYDIVALRVIVPTVEDCYKVLGIIHNMWRPFPGRIKDFIALPKQNGYRSIHTTIFTGDGGVAEIQIRTPEMHRQAEYGIASHYAYKNDAEVADSQYLQWLKDLAEFEDRASKDFVKDMKNDLFNNRIFVFTPEGDVIDLPEGSSVIDFAYAIHSHVGAQSYSSKINGKHSALKSILSNGDIVSVETKESSHPTSKWLDYAKTSLARKHIQRYLRDNQQTNNFNKFFKH